MARKNSSAKGEKLTSKQKKLVGALPVTNSWRLAILIGVLLAVGTAGLYAPTLRNGFIELNPGEAIGYLNRGAVEAQGANYDAAIADYLHAGELSGAPTAYYWLGRAYEGKGDYSRAQGAYIAALRLAPGMTDAQARLDVLQKRLEATAR
jgi:tetratricopeptide (TPR) repeat protein